MIVTLNSAVTPKAQFIFLILYGLGMQILESFLLLVRSISHDLGNTANHHQHLPRSVVRQGISAASRQPGITKPIGWHTFATHPRMAGSVIRTIQERLGHKDVKTTMIYTHVLNKSGGRGIVSPAETIQNQGEA